MVFAPISKQEYDDFSRTHPKGHIFQSTHWAAVKERWQVECYGASDLSETKLQIFDALMEQTGERDRFMPSGFDDFSERAHRDDVSMSQREKENLSLLTSAMTACGFTTSNSEWWHFDDSDWAIYPVLDVHLENFSE